MESDGDKASWKERQYQCIIAVAKSVETKTIVERIPGYMGLDFSYAYGAD